VTEALQQQVERQRSSYVLALDASLRRMVDHLASMPSVQRVILFGSYAHGRRDLFTDLDLLVVMESDLDYVSRVAALYQELAPGVDMDLLVYTPLEYEQVRRRPFVRRAVESGRVLLAR